MSLAPLLARNRVVVVVGCGGVGKTTTAAALAVHAAMTGRRVLCMTIDPARRLANSLGLSQMTTEEQEISRAVFEENDLPLKGSLSAMMLDTKRTFDDLVHRYASSPERAKRILDNRLYQYVSTSLAGTQDYMAMEKLHAVRGDPRFDLIVLDTPPTSNALDFLDAPERLVAAIDSPAMRWFVQAFQGAGKLSLGLVGKGAAFLIRGLARFTGAEFLDSVAELVVELNDLFGGFRDRAREVSHALRGPEVGFVIVTSPEPLATSEALFFARRLAELGIDRDAFVINGLHPLLPEPPGGTESMLAEVKPLLPPSVDAAATVRRLCRALDDERLRAVADRIETDRLKQRAGHDALYVEVPLFEEDVHDLPALARVAQFLTIDRSSDAPVVTR
jgi:anion-transporting  ArsA/GET3 family ATPase